jgi:hypothetical protein
VKPGHDKTGLRYKQELITFTRSYPLFFILPKYVRG